MTIGPTPLIVDAHQDLAWNMLTFGRDYTRSVEHTRQLELGAAAPKFNGDTLLGWDAYQKGRVAVVFSTLFAAPQRRKLGDWDTLCYQDPDSAHNLYRQQADAYHRLMDEHPGKFKLIATRTDLETIKGQWVQPFPGEAPDRPVGLVLLMEGAEGVRQPAELEMWWELGVRLIGPAWAGTRFCGGTREPGPLTKAGYALLDAMADLGFALDISHMDEQAVFQSLDHYPARIIASHANAKSLLKGIESNRLLTDKVIAGLIERQGVIGVVPFNIFLDADWSKGNPRELVPLSRLVDQIDHICQIAGNAHHVGIGSDFDGGFGLQSVPPELDTIADLQKLPPMLAERGYTQDDIAAILGGNWLALLEEILPGNE